mgnify:CR=1 FL=1
MQKNLLIFFISFTQLAVFRSPSWLYFVHPVGDDTIA